MKLLPLILIATLLYPTVNFGQTEEIGQIKEVTGPPMSVTTISRKHWVYGTLSAGFMNGYKKEYTVPAGFEKGNTSGFTPIYARIEYGIADMVTLGFSTSWSTIYFNSFKTDMGYNGPIKRYYPNKWRLFSGGLIAYYHFDNVIYIPYLDLFVGAGINLNNISENARPQGDSIITQTSHTALPTIKIGARYSFAPHFSVFGDVGYDKLSIFSVGVSCSFLPKRYRQGVTGYTHLKKGKVNKNNAYATASGLVY